MVYRFNFRHKIIFISSNPLKILSYHKLKINKEQEKYNTQKLRLKNVQVHFFRVAIRLHLKSRSLNSDVTRPSKKFRILEIQFLFYNCKNRKYKADKNFYRIQTPFFQFKIKHLRFIDRKQPFCP